MSTYVFQIENYPEDVESGEISSCKPTTYLGKSVLMHKIYLDSSETFQAQWRRGTSILQPFPEDKNIMITVSNDSNITGIPLLDGIIKLLEQRHKVVLYGHGNGGIAVSRICERLSEKDKEKYIPKLDNFKAATFGSLFVATPKQTEGINITNYMIVNDYVISFYNSHLKIPSIKDFTKFSLNLENEAVAKVPDNVLYLIHDSITRKNIYIYKNDDDNVVWITTKLTREEFGKQYSKSDAKTKKELRDLHFYYEPLMQILMNANDTDILDSEKKYVLRDTAGGKKMTRRRGKAKKRTNKRSNKRR